MRRPGYVTVVGLGLLVSILLIQACGFKLRGNVAFNPELAPVYIKDQGGGVSRIAILLRDTLVRQGIAVVDELSQANSVVYLSPERFARKVLTVNSTGQVQEYALTYEVGFSVNGKDNTELLAKTAVNVERVLRFDEAALSAKAAEASALQQSMLNDATQQVLRQMGYISTEKSQSP